MMSPPGARVLVDGVEYDYFGGTGYLGLQGHPEVIEAMCRAAQTLGVHTATSRSRYASQPVLNVERLAAEFFGTESAFYFASGYAGNAMLLQALRPGVDSIFLDEHSHYSVTEAARSSGMPVHEFTTRDPEDLARQLRAHLVERQRPLVMTDGVFPSFGQIAPIDRYEAVLKGIHGAAILVDDAHGFGVLGPAGRGTVDHHGMWERCNQTAAPTDEVRLFAVGTTSKALGGYGGILPASAALRDAAISASHHFDGASAPPAPIAAATARALQLVLADPSLRETLRSNIASVRTGLAALGIAIEEFPTPIVGFTRGDAAAMLRLHEHLAGAGILVPYAERYSGVGPEGAMRLAVFATHTDATIERLLTAMQSAP
jgi:7-keto-8-aminopelargonate synthetase-like enzyme